MGTILAGMLEAASLPPNSAEQGMWDDYFLSLRREFQYQCRLFSLGAIMPYQQWKYLRLRPQNFPHIRLAELAWMYHKGKVSLSSIKDAAESENPLETLRQTLEAETSPYWQEHLMFGNPIEQRTLRLSKGSQNLLIINTVVPVLYAFAMSHDNYPLRERVLELLRQLPAEQNYILRQWRECGLKVDNAADSQALIQLKRQYCD